MHRRNDILRHLLLATVILLLINPITLLVLTKSWVISLLTPLLAILVTILVYTFHVNYRIKVLWVNILLLSSVLYHGEIVFTTVLSKYDIPNIYDARGKYYFNKSFLKQHFSTDEFETDYYTNSQGYRTDVEYNPDKKIKTCDWLFLGDSFTQGAQVEFAEMFSSIIAKEHADKIVINAGISGAGMGELYNYLKEEGVKLAPERVFLQIGVFNDFFNVVEHQSSINDYFIDKCHSYRYLAYSLSEATELPLGRWCEPFQPTEQGNIDYNILFKKSSEKKEKDKRSFQLYLDKIAELCNSIHADLTIILIPSKEQISESCLNEVLEAYGISEEQLDLNFPNTWLKELCDSRSLQLIDLFESFKSADAFPFFKQDEHLNVEGNRIIAQEIMKEIHSYPSYKLISKGLKNERYPSLCNSNKELLFQLSENQLYSICISDSIFNYQATILKSKEELIHPTMSVGNDYIAYTQGNQEEGFTKVFLFNTFTGTSMCVNKKSDQCAAIPSFSPDGAFLAMPIWTIGKNGSITEPEIGIYDINNEKVICRIDNNGKESWRPIWINNGSSILFIAKEKHFVVKQYEIESQNLYTILDTGFDIWDIALSPSGKYLLFAGHKDDNWDLFRYDLSAKVMHQLTKTKANEWDPSFGRSDNVVYFAGEVGISRGIYKMNVTE